MIMFELETWGHKTSKIAVLKASPREVLKDYYKLMHVVDYEKSLPKDFKTVLKLNLSWTLFFPACSTPPWQLESVLKTLREDGYDGVFGC